MTRATTFDATGTRPALHVASPDYRGFWMVSFLNVDGAFEDIGSIVQVDTGWQSANGGIVRSTRRAAAAARYEYVRWSREDRDLWPLS